MFICLNLIIRLSVCLLQEKKLDFCCFFGGFFCASEIVQYHAILNYYIILLRVLGCDTVWLGEYLSTSRGWLCLRYQGREILDIISLWKVLNFSPYDTPTLPRIWIFSSNLTRIGGEISFILIFISSNFSEILKSSSLFRLPIVIRSIN